MIDLKVPAGKGIAGFVLSSGQPMAVSDVGEESSFYSEVDKTTGYSTQRILATPLTHRRGNRRPGIHKPPRRPAVRAFYSPAEMDRAASFAEARGARQRVRVGKAFRSLSEKVLSDTSPDDIEDVRGWLRDLRDSPEHREMMDLALLTAR